MAAPAHTMDTSVERENPNIAASEITEPVSQDGIAQKPVPERADPQQAATGPGTGTIETTGEKVPFKDQAHGYAKMFHGMATGNKEEKEYGEAKIHGDVK